MRKAKYGRYVIGLCFVLLIVACHHQKEKIITLQEAEGCLRNPSSEMKEAKNIWFLKNK